MTYPLDNLKLSFQYDDDFGDFETASSCVDIDECTTGDNTCHEKHAHCHNIIGGYQCECHDGFEGDGRSCFPIDHCNDPKLNECDDNAKCVNTDGTYECECNAGFRGTGRRCININECQERTHAKGFIWVI